VTQTMLAGAQNHIETAGVAAYLGRDDLLRRLCFTSAEVAQTFEGYEAYAQGRHQGLSEEAEGNTLSTVGRMAHRGISDPQHTIQCTGGAGRQCTPRTLRCDQFRNRARRSSGRLLGLHRSRAGSPGGGLSKNWVRHKADVLQCGITYGGSLRGARLPGHGREPQQEEERRLRDPHVVVAPPRGGHRICYTQN